MKILQDISFKEKFSIIVSVVSLITMGIVAIIAVFLFTSKVNDIQKDSSKEVYLLADNKVVKLLRSNDYKSSLDASLKGSLELFHHYLWSLEPYKEYIEHNLKKAFDMSDHSVLNLRNVLNDKGFYSNLLAGKHSTRYQIDLNDSVEIDYTKKPYQFTMYGKLRILKPHEVELRNLITTGKILERGNSVNNFIGYDIIDYKVTNFDLLKTLDYSK